MGNCHPTSSASPSKSPLKDSRKMKIVFPPIPGSCLVLASLMMLSQAFTTVEGKPAEKADKEPDCFICQLLVVSVEVSIIGNNVTMDVIVETASSMCDGLGAEDSGIVQQCHNLIEEYLEQIIDMIVVQFFQPYDVCAYLKLCP